MSVVVVTRFNVANVDVAIKSLHDQSALLENISADAKAQGAQHHRFVQDGKQLVVIDEWDKPESFQKFFQDNAKIARVTENAGVQGPPTSEFYETVESADSF